MFIHRRVQSLCLLVAAATVAACTAIPVTNIPKLMALDLETMDIGDVQMAVRVQDSWEIRDKGVKLSMSYKSEATGEELSEEFVLTESDEPLTRVLLSKQKKNYGIHRYEMSDEAAERATVFRAKLLDMKAQHPGTGEASLKAGANMCLKRGANPFQNFRFTIFIRPDPAKDFFTVIKEQKIAVETKDGKVTYCGDEEVETAGAGET